VKIQQYLDRIGFGGEAKPDLKTLEKLLCCHLEQVPFENLDCYQNPHNLSLQLENLFDKIVTRRRGGICFELNGLFLWLLQCLGYDAYPILVRIQMGSKKLEPISHEAIIVTLDDRKYYCDVGFGGPAPKGLVSLDDRQEQQICGQTYRTVYLEGQYEICWLHHGAWESLFRFCDSPAAQEDFEILMYYFSSHPKSEFVTSMLLNRCLPDGSAALTDGKLVVRRGRSKTERILNTQEEIEDVLGQIFHLSI